MAPAAAGGGWDTTARAFQGASRAAKLDDGIEVFNVEGAGGTLGLSQLVSKGSGDPYQLMMTGLVMLGAIETNGSDVPLTRTTPIATLITETEAIVVPAKSKYRTFKELVADFKADPGSIRWAGGSAGGTDQLLVGQLARVLGVDARKTKYVAHSGGGEANAAILSGSVDAGVSGLSEFTDQVEAGKMRLLAVSSPVDTEVDGRKPQTIKDQGVDLELTNWRALVAPPGISDERARADHRVGQEGLATPEWQQERRALRLDAVRQDRRGARRLRGLGAEARAGGRRRARDRQAVIGARVIGGVLLAAGAIAFIATMERRRRVGGERAAAGARRLLARARGARRGVPRCGPGDDLEEHVEEAARGTHWPTPALLVGLLLGYVLLLEALGYALATAIFFWLAAWLLGSEQPARDAVVGVALGVVTSYAFSHWLNVQLPTGPWGV